jgi:hypothetical protein
VITVRALVACTLALAATAGVARAGTSYYPPLDSQIDTSEMPGDLARPRADGGPPVSERLRVKQFLYQEIKNAEKKDIGAKITLDLIAEQGFALDIPGLEEVLAVVFGEGTFHAEVTMREEHAADPAEDYPFILVIVPAEHQVALRFKSDVLKPVQPVTYAPYSGTPPEPELQLGMGIKIQVTYSWDGDADVQLVDAAGLRPTLSLNTPVQIGESGLVLEIQDAEIDLSRTSSPTGLPAAWIGVHFKRLALNFVNGLDVPRVEHGEGAASLPPQMAGVTMTDFSIGSGGVSGGICGNLTAVPTIPLFGTDFQLRRLCVTLQEGALTAGEVGGVLSPFPFFDVPVAVTLALSLDGNFKVALAPPDPAHPETLVDLPIPGVLVFHVEALSIERKAGVYVWKLSGKLNIDAISTAPDDAIRVDGLSISSNGDVMLDGGWLVLPGKKTIDFKGFAVELSEIGFGTESPGTPDSQKWVGFSGGIQLSRGFDAAARFKKLQFLWPGHGSAVDVRLSGVEVAFKKPGVISFEGALDFFKDPATGAEGFAGAVRCNIEAIRLATSGRLTIGKADPPTGPDVPFFYLDVAASLPAGIPLFSNVSLYGFLGLFGYNVAPNLTAFTSPVEWFEAHRVATNILAGAPPPWKVQDGAFALGAGAIVGTTADDGFAVNAKLGVMVTLPGPVVMLQGAANIAKKRGELIGGGRPLFTCLAIFDGTNDTFLLNIGAFYEVANLIKIRGDAEAFYNLADPDDWHVWIGKDQPEERRITAEVLSFLKASAYFMIDPVAYKQGAKAGYDKTYKFGPLKVKLAAFFGYDMALAYRPIDIWGQVEIKGEIELRAFGIGVGLTADASLSGETPKPYFVDGKIHVKLSLPWPLPDPSADLKFHWEHPAPKEPVDQLVHAIGIEPRKVSPVIEPETLLLSGDTAALPPPTGVAPTDLCTPGASTPSADQPTIACNRPLVPQDVMLVASLQRPTNDPNQLGYGNDYDPTNPHVDTVNDTHFEYRVTGIELVQAKKGPSMLTFDTPLTDLYAAWPALAGGPTAPAPIDLKVFSRNPLDVYAGSTFLFYNDGTEGWTEWAADRYGESYCEKLVPGHGFVNDKRCRYPDGLVNRSDFVLPPYSAFRFTVDGEVLRDTSGPARAYRNTVIFHTEGPPLELEPYVDTTSSIDLDRPHYRAYDVGVRFNDTYLDLLYGGDEQRFQIQLLDDNDQPVQSVGSELLIGTDWDRAADHVPRPTEDDWLQFLRDHGVPVDSIAPKDNRVFGRVSIPDAIRGGERYRVRIWLEDDRLATDARLTDAAWLAANPVRYHAGNRAVVYEFSLLASLFRDFRELILSYPGNYLDQPAGGTATRATLLTQAERAAGAVVVFPPALTNANANELGRYLRHVLSPRGPEAVSDEERDRWLRRAPGFHDKPERMTDPQRQALAAVWNDALGAFDAIEQDLALETVRRPLPTHFELRALVLAGDVVGWLIEAPEPIDFTRILIQSRPIPGLWSEALVVPNRDNTRAFVFRRGAGEVAVWGTGTYALRFTLHRAVGTRYAPLRHPDGLAFERATLIVALPDDRFVPGSP